MKPAQPRGTILQRHTSSFQDAGSKILIETDFIANGESISRGSGYFKEQRFVIENRWNSFGARFGNVLTPEALRKLADELEKMEKKVYRKNR